MRRALTLVALPLLLSATSFAASNRFTLAGQLDFGAKRGFYLDLECESQGNANCALANLKLYFAAADGKAWQFPGFTPPQGWEYGHSYRATGTVRPDGGIELSLDGQVVAKAQNGALLPQGGKLISAQVPDWASAPADYRVQETGLTLNAGSAQTSVAFPSAAEAPAALYLLGKRESGQETDFTVPAGVGLTVTATFVLSPALDWKALAPLVDKFGQSRYGSWPEKLTSESELADAMKKEDAQYQAWGQSKGYDRYGGYAAAPWKESPTGFFRTVKRDGRYWLISPEGWPTFYTGVCTAPDFEWDFTPVAGREALFAELPPVGPFRKDNVWGGTEDGAYASMQGMNAIRKYGDAWKDAVTKDMIRRIHAWGFSGLGKWCDAPFGLPSLPVLDNPVAKLVRHLDPWDSAARKALATSLRAQIVPRRFDSNVVGWSIGNEYDEIVTSDEIRGVLKDHSGSPASNALLEEGAKIYGGDASKRDDAWKAGIPDADLERLRGLYARTYYHLLYSTVKEIDPNHLYLGFWIVPGWWQNENDWAYIAPNCDVIGYDRYNAVFADEWFTKLLASTDKPALCGEFSFPPYHDGLQGFGKFGPVSVDDEAAAGAAYSQWIQDAVKNPFCVGGAWFQYRDEPITGRGPGHGTAAVYGEDFAFGLVDVTDRPKWPLVRAARESNLAATARRLKH